MHGRHHSALGDRATRRDPAGENGDSDEGQEYAMGGHGRAMEEVSANPISATQGLQSKSWRREPVGLRESQTTANIGHTPSRNRAARLR
jgi:hypothetical protein